MLCSTLSKRNILWECCDHFAPTFVMYIPTSTSARILSTLDSVPSLRPSPELAKVRLFHLHHESRPQATADLFIIRYGVRALAQAAKYVQYIDARTPLKWNFNQIREMQRMVDAISERWRNVSLSSR